MAGSGRGHRFKAVLDAFRDIAQLVVNTGRNRFDALHNRFHGIPEFGGRCRDFGAHLVHNANQALLNRVHHVVQVAVDNFKEAFDFALVLLHFARRTALHFKSEVIQAHHEGVARRNKEGAARIQNQRGKKTAKARTENALHVLEQELDRIEGALGRRIVHHATGRRDREHKAEERTHKAQKNHGAAAAARDSDIGTCRKDFKSNRRIEADALFGEAVRHLQAAGDNAIAIHDKRLAVFARRNQFIFFIHLLDRTEGHNLFRQEHGENGDHDDPTEERRPKIDGSRHQDDETDYRKQ